jgi:hypothetical protein
MACAGSVTVGHSDWRGSAICGAVVEWIRQEKSDRIMPLCPGEADEMRFLRRLCGRKHYR